MSGWTSEDLDRVGMAQEIEVTAGAQGPLSTSFPEGRSGPVRWLPTARWPASGRRSA
jgi:hypothetical protein